MAKKSKQPIEDDEDDDPVTEESSNKKVKEPSKGLNYTAIALMLMFGLPVVLALVVQSLDFFYPEAAKERKIKDRVMRCYEAANPTKVSEVDKFIKKYKGKEYALFAQLRNKYEKFPECH